MVSLHSHRYHVIVDITNIPHERTLNKEGLEEFLNSLPGKIGMTVLNPAIVIAGVESNPGLTGFVIIDFSHCSTHTFSKYNEALVDVFSCKPYDQEELINTVLTYFEVDKRHARIKEVHWG
ncbi:MAG: S-adenosylmethionine decarboxylase [Microgenomates group bacterium Gr01-1014_5]|nr:MAG: S-adenosylmethionine decarboxylase [Microgenomates group bacterium Gr01-1014_5]